MNLQKIWEILSSNDFKAGRIDFPPLKKPVAGLNSAGAQKDDKRRFGLSIREFPEKMRTSLPTTKI